MDNKIKKLYLKYSITENIKYINKIKNLLKLDIPMAGGSVFEKQIGSIDLIIKNIDLITEDIQTFNKLLQIVKEHDEKIILFKPDYKIYEPQNQTLLEYIELIYNYEKNLI